MKARTMVYLDADQLKALRVEARARGISLAELLRRIVGKHLGQRQWVPPGPSKAYLRIVGLGSSGQHDISERHDGYLGKAPAP